jgi:hypothetical protein
LDRLNAKQREQVRRDALSVQQFRLTKAGQGVPGKRVRAERAEGRLALAEEPELGLGPGELIGATFRRLRRQTIDAVRLLEVEAFEKDVVDEREDGRIGASVTTANVVNSGVARRPRSANRRSASMPVMKAGFVPAIQGRIAWSTG